MNQKTAIIDELQRRASNDYGCKWFTEIKEWSDETWTVKVAHSESGAVLSNGVAETWRDVWYRDTDGSIERQIRYLPLDADTGNVVDSIDVTEDVLTSILGEDMDE